MKSLNIKNLNELEIVKATQLLTQKQIFHRMKFRPKESFLLEKISVIAP